MSALWNKQKEIDLLKDALFQSQETNERLRAEVEALRQEQARDDLRFARLVKDGLEVIGNIDVYDEALVIASAFGRDEPNDDDYAASMRTAIDALTHRPE